MKLSRNLKFSIENFSDGEVMLYDNNGEIYHILNNTAAYVLSIIERDSNEVARNEYVSWVVRTFGEPNREQTIIGGLLSFVSRIVQVRRVSRSETLHGCVVAVSSVQQGEP